MPAVDECNIIRSDSDDSLDNQPVRRFDSLTVDMQVHSFLPLYVSEVHQSNRSITFRPFSISPQPNSPVLKFQFFRYDGNLKISMCEWVTDVRELVKFQNGGKVQIPER
jgi:hypothetical protein